MFQWPIDLSLDGSPQKMSDHCEEIIEELEKTSNAGGNVIRILPTFEMSNNTGLKKLKLYGKDVFIDEESYIKFELHRRVVYISKDSPDKRPFIYWGGSFPFNGSNNKVYLEQLVVGSVQDPRTKVVYRDKDQCNLKTSNITFEAKEVNDPVVKNDTPEPSAAPTSMHDIISGEEKEALQQAIFGDKKEDNREEDGSIVIPDKVQKIMDNIDKTRGLTPLEQQYLIHGNIDSNDTAKLRHSWLGVTSYETKHGTKYTATLKGVTIQSGFGHPVDAARKYNEFIIEHGLPYPVNNIPGFLELEILQKRRTIGLNDYKTWELTAEVHRRVMPEEDKF